MILPSPKTICWLPDPTGYYPVFLLGGRQWRDVMRLNINRIMTGVFSIVLFFREPVIFEWMISNNGILFVTNATQIDHSARMNICSSQTPCRNIYQEMKALIFRNKSHANSKRATPQHCAPDWRHQNQITDFRRAPWSRQLLTVGVKTTRTLCWESEEAVRDGWVG